MRQDKNVRHDDQTGAPPSRVSAVMAASISARIVNGCGSYDLDLDPAGGSGFDRAGGNMIHRKGDVSG